MALTQQEINANRQRLLQAMQTAQVNPNDYLSQRVGTDFAYLPKGINQVDQAAGLGTGADRNLYLAINEGRALNPNYQRRTTAGAVTNANEQYRDLNEGELDQLINQYTQNLKGNTDKLRNDIQGPDAGVSRFTPGLYSPDTAYVDRQLTQGNANFGDFSRRIGAQSQIPSMGGYSGPAADKINQMRNEATSNARTNLAKGLTEDYARRTGTYQNILNSNIRRQQQAAATAAAGDAANQAKKDQQNAGLLGLAGTAGGALAGGPVGAIAGGAIGSALSKWF